MDYLERFLNKADNALAPTLGLLYTFQFSTNVPIQYSPKLIYNQLHVVVSWVLADTM